MLQKILAIVTRPPAPFALGVLMAVALVWFGGHFLQKIYYWPSDPTIALVCVLVVVAAVLVVVLRTVRARRQARAIENEIRNQAKAQAASLPPGSQSEIDALQQRFDEALGSLKSSRLGRGALYAMPWFIIIGPPGSGKTTAITESGLNFPFMKGPNQKRGIRGLGGTRNCDWWFTDQSILLDTAGRYTTQAEDHDEWLAFLGMLKKGRKLKPINGVLVAISITDVLGADEEGLERHATTIRQRIDELVKQLEVVFPIYLMFTKCDLLDGFVEFFSAMSKEERAQVWGTTFDLKTANDGEMHTRFAAEFDLLCARTDQERMRLLVPDRPIGQQQKVFSLSLQLRAAKRKLSEFVRLLTQPNPYSDASELRGVYLTSGTQEGAPIDLVLQKLSSAFGLPSKAEGGPVGAVEQKSYFIRDLFTKVIYADRELAHSSATVQRRRELARKGVIFGSAAAALVMTVTSLMTWVGTRSALFAVGDANRELSKQLPDAKRQGEPPEATRQNLNALRDRYLTLQQAYSSTSLLGPSRDSVLDAMRVYAAAMGAAFLEPASEWIRKKLDAYVAGDNGLDLTANSQLVSVYAAMDGEYVVDDKLLHDALQQQYLWRWSPDDIGKSATTVKTSEESKHLDAFILARHLDSSVWVVKIDNGTLGKARVKLNSGSETKVQIEDLLKKDPTLRNAAKEDLPRLVVERLEEKRVTKVEQSPALLQQIETQWRTEVLTSTANIGLTNTTSLEKLRDSLAELTRPESLPLKTFEENIRTLRGHDLAPPPGVGPDNLVLGYAAALKDVADLSAGIAELARSGNEHYVLPEVRAGKAGPLAAFWAQWNKAQTSVQGRIHQISELLPAESSKELVHAIDTSLRRILGSILNTIGREARREMQKHWNDTVGLDLKAYAERFPCRRDAKEEVDVATFNNLFSPGGKLDQALEILTQMGNITELKSALGLDRPFEDMVKQVRSIQKGCFGPDLPGKARLQFHLAMNKDPLVEAMVLTIAVGNNVSTQDATPGMILSKVRTWTVGDAGAQLLLRTQIELPNKTKLPLPYPREGAPSSPWGFLRLLADRDATVERTGNDAKVTFDRKHTYEDGSRLTVQIRCSLLFKPEGAENPLTPNFFVLEPADRIFQANDQ